MKKFLFLPFFAMLILLMAFRGKSPESSPRYDITESKADAKLQAGQSVFEFNFYAGGRQLTADSIQLSYNKTLKTIKPQSDGKYSLIVKPGNYRFQFFYNTEHFEIITDSIEIKPAYRTKMNVFFESSRVPVICEKPVIYVYPDKTRNISVQLNVKGQLAFTYPEYKNGWNFTADPNGTIHLNGKEYDYLFWDAQTSVGATDQNWNEGFLVGKDSLISFFETKLSAMGLNPREKEDFITYWCPRMNANDLNYVHFVFNADYDQYASLNVNPKPDKIFRVYMVWSKADASMQIKEQKIESFSRSGFTLVEWGGAEVPDLNKLVKPI